MSLARTYSGSQPTTIYRTYSPDPLPIEAPEEGYYYRHAIPEAIYYGSSVATEPITSQPSSPAHHLPPVIVHQANGFDARYVTRSCCDQQPQPQLYVQSLPSEVRVSTSQWKPAVDDELARKWALAQSMEQDAARKHAQLQKMEAALEDRRRQLGALPTKSEKEKVVRIATAQVKPPAPVVPAAPVVDEDLARKRGVALAMEQEVARKRAELEEVDNALAERQRQLRTLTTQLSQSATDLSTRHDKQGMVESAIASQQSKLQQLALDASTKQDGIDQLTRRLAQLQQECSDLHTESLARQAALATDLRMRRSQLEALQDEELAHQRAIAGLAADRDQLQREMDASRAEMERQRADFRKEVAAQTDLLRQKQRQLQELDEAVGDRQRAVQLLGSEQQQQLQQQRASSEAQLSNEKSALSHDIDRLQSHLRALEAQVASKEQVVTSLHDQLNLTRKEVLEAESKRDDLLMEARMKEAELAALEVPGASLAPAMSIVSASSEGAEEAAAQARLQQADADLARKTQALIDLTQELHALQCEFSEHEAKVKEQRGMLMTDMELRHGEAQEVAGEIARQKQGLQALTVHSKQLEEDIAAKERTARLLEIRVEALEEDAAARQRALDQDEEPRPAAVVSPLPPAEPSTALVSRLVEDETRDLRAYVKEQMRVVADLKVQLAKAHKENDNNAYKAQSMEVLLEVQHQRAKLRGIVLTPNLADPGVPRQLEKALERQERLITNLNETLAVKDAQIQALHCQVCQEQDLRHEMEAQRVKAGDAPLRLLPPSCASCDICQANALAAIASTTAPALGSSSPPSLLPGPIRDEALDRHEALIARIQASLSLAEDPADPIPTVPREF